MAMVHGRDSGGPRIFETAVAFALHGPISIGLHELPEEFFLVSLARSCCQSFPGEPTHALPPSPETRHIVSVSRRDRILLSSGASISCLLELGRRVRSFTASELRCASSRCVESAVGLDGLPYSLFKVMFLVAERVGEVVQPYLGVGCCPILVETQHRCLHFQAK